MESEIAQVYTGDCKQVLKSFPDNHFDSIVTDPPAGISFMGKDWDHDRGGRDQWIAWMTEVAIECLRVLKPGGHALVWSIPRTSHWTAMSWENAGFEVRDVIAHVFGQGFPKSLNVSKAIDKHAGVERKVSGKRKHPTLKDTSKIEEHANAAHGRNAWKREWDITEPYTENAKQWEGWGTALKPAREDWWLLRKPISEKTIAANVLKWGTGAINIDGCRIDLNGDYKSASNWRPSLTGLGDNYDPRKANQSTTVGRYPSNFTHDGDQLVLDLFPDSKGQQGEIRGTEPSNPTGDNGIYSKMNRIPSGKRNDNGSAARFFYCSKVSRKERNAGLYDMEERPILWSSGTKNPGSFQSEGTNRASQNNHPTVKPVKLMQYFCRLITPPGGIILDPFAGSGSIGVGAIIEHFRIVCIEKDEQWYEVINKRLMHAISMRPYNPNLSGDVEGIKNQNHERL